MNKRENNYDLLRILSAVGVVFIHINQYYMGITKQLTPTVYVIQDIFEVFTRFGVPCFIMISGAFLLSNPKNKEYGRFYKRSFVRTILPFLIVSASYLVFDITKAVIAKESLSSVFLTYLEGNQYNLWFIPMITGLYLITPVVLRFKESVSTKAFGITSFVWLALAVAFINTETYLFAASYAKVFAYLGYFMVGSFLYDNARGKVNTGLLAVIAFSMYTLRIVLRSTGWTWIFIHKNVYFYPTIVIGGIAVFMFFGNIRFPFSLRKPASVMLYVYLFHTFVFRLVLRIIGNRIILEEATTAFLMSLFCFTVSVIMGIVFKKLDGKLERKLL